MKKRKILISTLSPLGANYGGLMQAFALQEVLRDMGNEVATINNLRPIHNWRTRVGVVKRFVQRRIMHEDPGQVTDGDLMKFIIYTQPFVDKYMHTVDIHKGKRVPDIKLVKNYDTFVVGSDQAWRARYAHIPSQLFSYTDGLDVTRLSYAASFGRDDATEYTDELIANTSEYAGKFDGVSVREDSGVSLAKQLWGVSAIHHVDPTMLLAPSVYSELIENSIEPTVNLPGEVFVYVLDRTESTQQLVKTIVKRLKKASFELLPKPFFYRYQLVGHPEKYALPPVEQWLKSIRDADFVITDSFHGTVFSIIFNKRFVAIGNKNRGLARFTSLLQLFDLRHRLVHKKDDVTDELINTEIDWNKVNLIISREQKRSFEYLSTHLGKKDEQKS